MKITTLGELADALAELKEAQEAHKRAIEKQTAASDYDDLDRWAFAANSVRIKAERVTELRAQPVEVALPAELCEAMRGQINALNDVAWRLSNSDLAHANAIAASEWAAASRGDA